MCTVIKIILCIFVLINIGTCLQLGSECKTKQDEDGICKSYSDCPSIIDKLRSQEILLSDIFMCPGYGVICCPEPRIRIKGEISKRKCKEIEKFTQSETRVGVSILNPSGTLVTSSKCKHKSVPLIVGGEEASRYEFPHQVHLGYETRHKTEWACGGSLISSNYVLTAAHCNGDRGLGRIKYAKLGMIDRSQNDNDVLIYNVKKVIAHDQYSPRTFNNDIALIELEGNVIFSEFIYPICLPTRQHDEPKVVVSGLGKTGRMDAQSEKLLKVVLEKFSHTECQEKLRSKKIDQVTMMCYGDHLERKDACGGDSGSPVQVANDEESHCTYKVVGVVSFGAADCGTPGIPGVFVNVYNYLSWIEDIVWKDEN